MTQVQVNYWAFQENRRHNFATESQAKSELGETIRHNMTVEGETNRHNLVTEGQGDRDLDIKEFAAREQQRTNKANEKLRGQELDERKRSNKANEALKSRQLAQEYERIKSQIKRNDVENALTNKKISRYDIEVLSKLGKAGQYVGLAELGVTQAAELATKAEEFLKNTTYNKTSGEYTFKGSSSKPAWLSDTLSQLMKGMDAYDKRTGGIGKW
jgi:hypothetical protein